MSKDIKTLSDLFDQEKMMKPTPEVDPFAGAFGGESSADVDFMSGKLAEAGIEEEFSEDFTGETAGGRLASEGLHRCKVIDIELTTSSKGDPMYVWTFEVVDTDEKGVQLKLFTVSTPKARWKIIETLEGVGIPASNSVVRFKKSDIKDRICIVNVIHESYKGRMQASVVRVMTEEEALNYTS